MICNITTFLPNTQLLYGFSLKNKKFPIYVRAWPTPCLHPIDIMNSSRKIESDRGRSYTLVYR